MKIMLLFPSNWTPSMPHLSLPRLTAYLRQHDIGVIQRDLNVEVFDEILTKKYLKKTLSHLWIDYGDASIEKQHEALHPQRKQILWALRDGAQLINEVEEAKAIIRSEAFYDDDLRKEAFRVINQCLEIASLPHYPSSLTLETYSSAFSVDTLQAVQDEQHNIFLDIFRRGILEDIKHEKPALVGITISSMSQMLAAMTLCYLIKHESNLDCHVTLGGTHISLLCDALGKEPQLFNFFDTALGFEEETTFLQLIEAIEKGEDFSHIPNLIYKAESSIHVNEYTPQATCSTMPLPDFDGLPLEKYFVPRLVLPLLTPRDTGSTNLAYKQVRTEQLANQMMALRDKYGAEYFFVDEEAVTPRNLHLHSPSLEAEANPIQWGDCMHFGQVTGDDKHQSISRAGCRMIRFGSEGTTEKVINTFPNKNHPQFYANDIYRFLYAAYISAAKESMSQWLIPEHS